MKPSATLRVLEYELIEKQEAVLEEFAEYLKERQEPRKKISRWLAHLHCFLIDYHTYHYLESFEHLTPERLEDFIQDWYHQRKPNVQADEIRSVLRSILHFLRFLHSQQRIDAEQYDVLSCACQLQEQVCPHEEFFHRRNASYSIPTHDADTLIASPPPSFEWLEKLYFHNNDRKTAPEVDELLDELLALMGTDEGQSGKVISLENYRNKNQAVNQPSAPQVLSLKDRTEIVRSHAFALHRGNLVFVRWLERLNRSMNGLPHNTRETFEMCDGWLELFLRRIEQGPMHERTVEKADQALDRLAHLLWELRHWMAEQLHADLRQLCV